MNTTDVVAWIGAVTGSASLLWDFYKWKTAGPKLRLRTLPNLQILGETPGGRIVPVDNYTYVFVEVTNVGEKKTTITNIGLLWYTSWYSRKPAQTFVSPKQPHPLPRELDVGQTWGGQIVQDEEVEKMARSGRLYAFVCHSSSNQPAKARITIGEPKAKHSAPAVPNKSA